MIVSIRGLRGTRFFFDFLPFPLYLTFASPSLQINTFAISHTVKGIDELFDGVLLCEVFAQMYALAPSEISGSPSLPTLVQPCRLSLPTWRTLTFTLSHTKPPARLVMLTCQR
jgi:hypothetical protein